MDAKKEILDAVEILIQAAQKNSTKIYTGLVTNVGSGRCTVQLYGEKYIVKYYGDAPQTNMTYPMFIPQGNFSDAFIIVSSPTNK